jgi:serine/threonine protein kinase
LATKLKILRFCCFVVSARDALSIVVDVADALEYLHHNQGTIVHCDIKPSNTLLDDSMTTHVGDFDLARFIVDPVVSSPDDSYSASSIAIDGTIGYVAPGISKFYIQVSSSLN